MSIGNLPVLPPVDHPDEAIDRLSSRLKKLGAERLPWSEVVGRVLAEDLRADRDSPPLAVSAMDGYAIAQNADEQKVFPIKATIRAGEPSCEIVHGSTVKIFTGAPVPSNAYAVIPREQTREVDGCMELMISREEVRPFQHIRKQGENGKQGDVVLKAGTLIGPAEMGAIATFTTGTVAVYRKLRLAIANTGDELVPPGLAVESWQIRDSNGPVLRAMIESARWIELVEQTRLSDKLPVIEQWLKATLPKVDAILLTGGVSMGDSDFVPEAIRAAGGDVVFHRIPIRPGKPILGATGASGELILGLPGNPVSVAVTCRRIGFPLMQIMQGFSPEARTPMQVKLIDGDRKSLGLHWYRLVKHAASARGEEIVRRDGVTLTPSQGSGDLISLSHSCGFIEIPKGRASDEGPWDFYSLRW